MTLYIRTLGFPADGWLAHADRALARIERAKAAWPQFDYGWDIVAPYLQKERVPGSGKFAYELDQRSQLLALDPTHKALNNWEMRAGLQRILNAGYPVHVFFGEFHGAWRDEDMPQANWLNRMLLAELSGALVPGVTIGLGHAIGSAGETEREDDAIALYHAIADRGCRLTSEARIEQNIGWHQGLQVGLYCSVEQWEHAKAGRSAKGQSWEKPENIAGEKIVHLDLTNLPKPNKESYPKILAANLAAIETQMAESSVTVNSADVPGYGG